MARQKAKRAVSSAKERRDHRRTPEGVTLLVDNISDSSTNLEQAKKFIAKFLEKEPDALNGVSKTVLRRIVGRLENLGAVFDVDDDGQDWADQIAEWAGEVEKEGESDEESMPGLVPASESEDSDSESDEEQTSAATRADSRRQRRDSGDGGDGGRASVFRRLGGPKGGNGGQRADSSKDGAMERGSGSASAGGRQNEKGEDAAAKKGNREKEKDGGQNGERREKRKRGASFDALQALRKALNRECSEDEDEQEDGKAGDGRSGWADVYDSSSDEDFAEKQNSSHKSKDGGRAKREPVVLVEAPRSERTMVLQRGDRELESKNLYRGYVSSAHNVTSYVTGTKRARQVRNQAELENLARAVDLLVSQFGKRVITKVDAVEVILRRMSCVYLADQQESWAMARHLEENPSSLPIPPKMMLEARKAAKLMNPRLMITTPNFQPRGEFRDQGSYQGRSDRSQVRERERVRDSDRRRGNEWDRGREERGGGQRERVSSAREQPRSRPRP